MTFLNPLYLIALAAAAIPIILHLLNLRKTRVIEFSTLTFLKELQRSRIRKLKIRQWILLALRTLIVVFIVLAFTRPALRSTLGFLPGTQARSSVVIVLDDSFSMFASDNEGRLFKQAKAKAKAVLDMLTPGDEVALIRMSTARREDHRFTAAIRSVHAELDAAEPSFRHTNMGDVLEAASALFGTSSNFNKELYVISDEQRTHFTRENSTRQSGLFDPSLRVFLFPLGASRADNSAVTEITVESSLFEKNKPVELRATVYNDQRAPLSDALVSVFLDGERMVQSSVEVAPGGRADVRFTVVPKKSGFIQGFVELEDDAIPEDNRRFFSFYVPENVRVLLGPTGGQDAAITRLALEPGETDAAAAPLRIQAVDKAALLSANLASYDVVLLLGGSFSSAGFTERLAAWTRAGGGVMLFPDGTGTQDVFSRTLLPSLGIPAAAGMRGSPGSASVASSFAAVDYEHPLFRTIFLKSEDGRPPAIEAPEIYALMRLRGDESAQQVIGTSSGDAFLLDRRLGAGRVLVFGVAPNLSWSSFPLKGVFVPLLHRSMFYLASREDAASTHIIGETFDMLLPPSANAGVYEMETPEGGTVKLSPKELSSGLSFTLSDLEQPGTYVVRHGDDALRAVSMNIDPSESAMEKMPATDRDSYFASLGVERLTVLGRAADVQRAVTEARFGVELWKYMLGLAILCAVLEMLIARDSRRNTPAESAS